MRRSQGIPPTRPWHSSNVPLPRAPSKRGLQHGRRPVGSAALFTTKVSARPTVEVIVEGCFEEGRAADRAKSMLELPLGGGSGERHVQRMPEAVSEGVFGIRDPLGRQLRQMQNRSPQGEMLATIRFSANNGRQQAPETLLSIPTVCRRRYPLAPKALTHARKSPQSPARRRCTSSPDRSADCGAASRTAAWS